MGLGDLIREVRTVRQHGKYLLPHLVSQLYTRREVTLRPDMWFSPSQLSHMCPRAYAIAWKLGLPLVDEVTSTGRWYMDLGTAMHSLIQDMWGGEGGWLEGGWKCTACAHVHGIDPDDKTPAVSHGEEQPNKVTIRSAVREPECCANCGMTPGWRRGFTYEEPLLYDLDLKVAGWTDGILVLPGQPAELMDIKTTGNLYWVRSKPNDDHVTQLSWYMAMAGMKRGRIIYVDRTAKKLETAIVEHPFFLDQRLMTKQKEMVRGLRKVLAAPKSDTSIPDCPDGGRGPWGPCDCRELEDAWASARR